MLPKNIKAEFESGDLLYLETDTATNTVKMFVNGTQVLTMNEHESSHMPLLFAHFYEALKGGL